MKYGIMDSIVRQSEAYLAEHGDCNLGVGWPTADSAGTHYEVMLDLVPRDAEAVTLLDVGCGLGGLLEHAKLKSRNNIDYTGLDVSPAFLAECRRKFPRTPFIQTDLLSEGHTVGRYDYVVANGIFTQRCDLDFESMWAYAQRMLAAMWNCTRTALAFNAMSSHVDWEREDLFHLPLDTVAAFLGRELSRNFAIRNDYGYYDFTVYIYR